MGFDKHFYEDHCYLDDGTEDKIGLNVEIIAEDMCSNSQQYSKLVASNSEFTEHNNYIIIEQEEPQTYDEGEVITQTIYPPITEYCMEHHGTYLLEDEKLVKPGDKFETHEDFIQYLNDNAKRWFFYYRCTDSHKSISSYESYTYNCVYLRNKEKYKPRGLRKRNNNLKTDCPCKIKIRQLPNETALTVVYVCNHHDHNLSEQEFYKLQHGRRLPPHIKEEIMDMLALRVDVGKIMKYVQLETGFEMTRPFFYTIERTMKNKNMERHMSEERFKEILQKISALDETDKDDIDESTDDLITPQKPKRDRGNNDSDSPKKLRRILNADQTSTPLKRRPKSSKVSSENAKRTRPDSSQGSSLDETIQSVKNLQQSVKCETQRNPWILDQCVPVLANRVSESGTKTNIEEPIQINIIEAGANDNKVIIESGNYDNEYTIHYYNDEVHNQVDNNERQEGEPSERIAFENDLTEPAVAIKQEKQVKKEYIDDDSHFADKEHETSEFNDSNNDTNTVEGNAENVQYANDETVQYITEGDHNVVCVYENGEIVQYILDMAIGDGDQTQVMEYNPGEVTEFIENVDNVTETTVADDNSPVRDVAVQTNDKSAKPGHSFMPVFDVYMKKGNVTGFVMNNNLSQIDKQVQTNQDHGKDSDNQKAVEDEDLPVNCITQVDDTLTKHEYVHKHNIAEYMSRSHFPKYIDILAKKTRTDVLHMLKNVYREKAMFKMTTTQKGKEGNTMIWYLADSNQVRKLLRRSLHDKLNGGKHLEEVYALKEEVKDLKQQNKELIRLLQGQECLDVSSQVQEHFE